jgi:hypothetical protein
LTTNPNPGGELIGYSRRKRDQLAIEGKIANIKEKVMGK